MPKQENFNPQFQKDRELQPLETHEVLDVEGSQPSELLSYFDLQRKRAQPLEGPEEELSYDQFLAEQQGALERLWAVGLEGGVEPSDVAMALSELSGNMAGRNMNIEANHTGYPDLDLENEREYDETKKVFMSGCRKIFPEVAVDIESESFETICADLEKNLGSFLAPEMSDADAARLLKEDPRKLAAWLDEALYLAGSGAKSKAWLNFGMKHDEQIGKGTDLAGYNKENDVLAGTVKGVYKLQMLRDQLQERMFGKSDISLADVEKMGAIRSDLGGEPFSGDSERKNPKPDQEDLAALVTPEHPMQWFNASAPSRDYNFGLDVDSTRVSMQGAIVLKPERFNDRKKLKGETTYVFLHAVRLGLQTAKANKKAFQWLFSPTDIGGKMKEWRKKNLDTGDIPTFVSSENVTAELKKIEEKIRELSGLGISIDTTKVEDQERYSDELVERIHQFDRAFRERQ